MEKMELDFTSMSNQELYEIKKHLKTELRKRELIDLRERWKSNDNDSPCVDVPYSDAEKWITENIKADGVAIIEKEHIPEDTISLFDFHEFSLRISFSSKRGGDESIVQGHTWIDTDRVFDDLCLIPYHGDLEYMDTSSPGGWVAQWEGSKSGEYFHAEVHIDMYAVTPKYTTENFPEDKEVSVVFVEKKGWRKGVIKGEADFQRSNKKFFIPTRK